MSRFPLKIDKINKSQLTHAATVSNDEFTISIADLAVYSAIRS